MMEMDNTVAAGSVEGRQECPTCETAVPFGFELHCLGKEHVKQALFGLRGVCIACSVDLYTPQAVKLHMEKPSHAKRMKRTCVLPGMEFEAHGWVCYSCALLFPKLLGYEVHLASSSHRAEVAVDTLSRVEALVDEFSAIPIRPSDPEFEPVCSMCEEACEGLDDFVGHVLSSQHVQRLRQCFCQACGKYLLVWELEAHLRSLGHEQMLASKTAPGNVEYGAGLKDVLGALPGGHGPAFSQHESRGWWTCTCCLIACRSWLAFARHVLDSVHGDNTPKDWTVVSLDGSGILFDPRMTSSKEVLLGCEVRPGCASQAAGDWKRWTQQLMTYSGWCHLCGTILGKPHQVELHLASHLTEQKGRSILVCELERTSPVPALNSQHRVALIFECKVCSVSFKDHFSLTVHMAQPQHRLRCSAANLSSRWVEWCESCGVFRREPSLQGSHIQNVNPDAVEEASASLHGSPRGTSAHTPCGDSFCTRSSCCADQPLVIEIPSTPGEDDEISTGSVPRSPAPSPSTTAKNMLAFLDKPGFLNSAGTRKRGRDRADVGCNN